MTGTEKPLRIASAAVGQVVNSSAALRRRRALIIAVAVVLQVAVLALLGLTASHHEILGAAGAVAVLLALVAAVIAGPVAGLAVACAGGVAFFVLVTDLGRTAPVAATMLATALWALSAIVAGVVADELRRQVAERRLAEEEAAGLHARLEASLLPSLPQRLGPFEVVALYRPGEPRLGLGGDFLDAVMSPDGRLAVVIGDVSGHGPDAAALGATLRASWRALVASGAGARQTVRTLAGILRGEQAMADSFATLSMAWIAPDGRRAWFLSLGHPPPLLIADDVRAVAVAPYLPLGVLGDEEWRSRSLALPNGWSLLFFTDGAVEGRAEPASEARYGLERLTARLGECAGGPITNATLDGLLKDIERANGGPLPDDVALLAVTAAGLVGRRAAATLP